MDDLKCDEVLLDVKMVSDAQNNSLVTNNVEINFNYSNNSNKNTHSIGEKATTMQAPLTPTYDKRKANSILMRKNTDR